jgi:NAD(P)-dependent dehydrogenase (short-subunit alcohol dehydrogenase family)
MTFFDFVSEQRTDLPLLATSDNCAGKTYIVTGANTGLGFEAAKTLTRVGAKKVILAVRNSQAGKEAKAQIDRETRTHKVTEVWPLDLSDDESVKSFAKMATEKLDRIDGLIANAGVAFVHWTTTGGHETCVKINVLSTMLLVVLMLPKLEESAQKFNIRPRVAIVSSSVAFKEGGPELEKIKKDPGRMWNDEKVADHSNMYDIQQAIQPEGIRTNQYLTDIPVQRSF